MVEHQRDPVLQWWWQCCNTASVVVEGRVPMRSVAALSRQCRNTALVVEAPTRTSVAAVVTVLQHFFGGWGWWSTNGTQCCSGGGSAATLLRWLWKVGYQ